MVAVEVADFPALMRQEILPEMNNKMARPAAQEVVELVMVHPHLQEMPVVLLCQDKDLTAEQVEMRRLPPA